MSNPAKKHLHTESFVEEAVFLFTQRCHIAKSWQSGSEALAAIDKRLEAALEGMLLNADASLNEFCLDEAIIMHPKKNRAVAGIGLGVTFYLSEGSTKESRVLLGRCSDDYLRRFNNINKSDITFGKWRKKQDQTLEEFLTEHDNPTEDFSILHSGNANFERLSLYTFVANSGAAEFSKHRNSVDYIMASIPLSALEGKSQGYFQEWIIHWTEILQPIYATVGYRVVYPIYSLPSYLEDVYPMLMRFPGLDDDKPWLFHKDEILCKYVKGAQWITFLNGSHVDSLGGKDLLIDTLEGDFQYLEVAGGLLIQAGLTAEFGDVNNDIYPKEYYRLGKVLKPIRYKEINSGNYIRPPIADNRRDATKAWLARFDEGSPND